MLPRMPTTRIEVMVQLLQADTHRTDRTRSKANQAAVQLLVPHQATKRCLSNRRDHLDRIHRRHNKTTTGQTRMRSLGDILTLRSRDNRIPINNDRDCMVSSHEEFSQLDCY